MEYFEDLEVSIEFKWNIDRLQGYSLYTALWKNWEKDKTA